MPHLQEPFNTFIAIESSEARIELVGQHGELVSNEWLARLEDLLAQAEGETLKLGITERFEGLKGIRKGMEAAAENTLAGGERSE